ncbi:MAG TPA: hypothetical protein VFQ74_04185 [Pseudolysinimonas sp.]|nr:hypothetical protein [Pseudolysinimonas sp.]
MNSLIGGARFLVTASLAGVAVLGVLGAISASPARAASPEAQPVLFSNDDLHWSKSYSYALFGGVMMVPGGSVDRPFYVRNGASDPAILRVTLFDVATTDTDLAGAMTVSTSLPGRPGPSIPVTDARPCATLSEGQLLAAGDSIRLDNIATLADLNGMGGQSSSVSFKLAVSLSSTDSAAPLPNTCPSDFSGTVIGSPEPGTGTASHPVYRLGVGGWTPAPAASTRTPAPGATAPASPSDTPADLGDLVANTQRFYQEDVVALWMGMAALGALLFFFVRRLRPVDGDRTEQYPYSRQPTTEIGVGR